MKGDKEFSGLLSGFDDYVSIIPFYSILMVDMVLDDVTEQYVMVDGPGIDFSTHGRKNPEKLGQILLNGNNVCMVSTGFDMALMIQMIPGGEGPSDSTAQTGRVGGRWNCG